MEDNNMNYEDDMMVMDGEDTADEGTNLGTGAGMLIGAGLTLAVLSAIKLGKKVYTKIKAKKELRQPDEVVEPTDEQIREVTAK